MTDNDTHECGFNCPFVVESEGSYVCTMSGRCFGQLFDLPAHDHGVLTVGKQPDAVQVRKGNAPNAMIAVAQLSRQQDDMEKHVSECVQLIKRLVADEKKRKNAKSVNTLAVKSAMRYVQSSPGDTNVVQAMAFAQVFSNSNAAQLDSEENEILYDTAARRCYRCYNMVSQNNNNKRNPRKEYIFLAFLYMMRDGLRINEVTLVERDPVLSEFLPNLHGINEYGFEKGKYTKADKFIRNFYKRVIGKRPVGDIRV